MPILTCRNHTNLRWSCKQMAWDGGKDGKYNHCRSIFFFGRYVPEEERTQDEPSRWDHFDTNGSYLAECQCPTKYLTLAPEQEVDANGLPTS